jgi:hypothetical protein
VPELKWHWHAGVMYRNESYLPPAARRLITMLREMFAKPLPESGKRGANR